MSIRQFIDDNFRHFNARETRDAARAWRRLLEDGGRMLLAMGGAMSTAEIGVSLAKMIRAGKVHAVCCTAANLEEDLFNLVAHDGYKVLPNYRDLSPGDETALRDEGFNRVADTCIPETVLRDIEKILLSYWSEAATAGESYFPHEYLFRLIRDGRLEGVCQAPTEESWLLAACETDIPIYAPGWEDSTLGNIFTARCMQGAISSHACVKPGTMQMEHLVNWYCEHEKAGVGFFQIGGGIAGDFPICAVPLILQDLRREVSFWSYFAQISDSTTSYGSYSGAAPNEKITWFKLAEETPKFMIASDATIVAPLVFAYVLGE